MEYYSALVGSWLTTFRESLEVPFLRANLLALLDLEDVTDKLSRQVTNHLP